MNPTSTNQSEEKQRQRAFDRAVNRIIGARSGICAAALAKSPPNRNTERLSAHLDSTWKACREGRDGMPAFYAALKGWEDESVMALDSMPKAG